MENPIPAQNEGTEMNAQQKAVFDSEEQAQAFYEVAKSRLTDINQWAALCELPSSAFRLCNAQGEEVNRKAQLGDYFKIDIPGPGTSTGEGFDWVKVEYIREEPINGTEQLSIRVRPAPNPQTPKIETAHFFKDTATSTFQVKRIGKEVYAEVHGRNEQPNTKTEHLADNIRNTMVGLGAKIGFSYPQWKGLVEGLVKV